MTDVLDGVGDAAFPDGTLQIGTELRSLLLGISQNTG